MVKMSVRNISIVNNFTNGAISPVQFSNTYNSIIDNMSQWSYNVSALNVTNLQLPLINLQQFVNPSIGNGQYLTFCISATSPSGFTYAGSPENIQPFGIVDASECAGLRVYLEMIPANVDAQLYSREYYALYDVWDILRMINVALNQIAERAIEIPGASIAMVYTYNNAMTLVSDKANWFQWNTLYLNLDIMRFFNGFQTDYLTSAPSEQLSGLVEVDTQQYQIMYDTNRDTATQINATYLDLSGYSDIIDIQIQASSCLATLSANLFPNTFNSQVLASASVLKTIVLDTSTISSGITSINYLPSVPTAFPLYSDKTGSLSDLCINCIVQRSDLQTETLLTRGGYLILKLQCIKRG